MVAQKSKPRDKQLETRPPWPTTCVSFVFYWRGCHRRIIAVVELLINVSRLLLLLLPASKIAPILTLSKHPGLAPHIRGPNPKITPGDGCGS